MNLEKGEERRNFNRILYTADATLTDSKETRQCRILDLSLQGCLLCFEEPWTASQTLYKLNLQLSDSVFIHMELSVSHVLGKEVGFKCEHIDIDSISQLRRLVELNLGDSALLERDLLALSNQAGH